MKGDIKSRYDFVWEEQRNGREVMVEWRRREEEKEEKVILCLCYWTNEKEEEKVLKNKIVERLILALGLNVGNYNPKALRYGKVGIFVDADE